MTALVVFSLPVGLQEGEGVVSQVYATGHHGEGSSADIDAACGRFNVRTWFAGCLTNSIVAIGGFAIWVSGSVFDFFLNLTLNPDFLNADYISNTWELMRDLANLVFIFGIIVVALIMITGVDEYVANLNWKTLAFRLVVIALLLNFSLFFSKVIIDAGNITGKFFYNRIVTVKGIPNVAKELDAGYKEAEVLGGGELSEIKSISAAITQQVDILKMIDVKALEGAEDAGGRSVHAFWFSFNVIFLFVSLMMAYSLLTVGFMFLSRTVSLIVLMILSPLAFVAWFIPKSEHYFKDWFKRIFDQSFCVCVYLFIIYLTLLILQGTLGGGQSDFKNVGGWTTTFFFVVINVMLVWTLINLANKKAKEMCEGTTGLGSTVFKVAAGAASLAGGGGALVGKVAARASLGRMGKNLIESTRVGEMGLSKNRFTRAIGNTLYAGGEKLGSAKFGLQDGYVEKLKKESQKVITRADTFANIIKPDIREEVIEKERNNLSKDQRMLYNATQGLEEHRLKNLDPKSEEYKKIRQEAEQQARKKGDNSETAIQMAMQDTITKQATEKADSMYISQDKVDKEVTTRTKQAAKEVLEQGRGSVINYLFAGAVSAYGEAADSYEVIDKADERTKREKAQRIEAQSRMARENQIKVDEMGDLSEELTNIFTDDDRGIVLDERSIADLVEGITSGEKFGRLDSILKESMTSEVIDAQGNKQTTFDQEQYDRVSANLKNNLDGLARFQGEVDETTRAVKSAESGLQSAQNNLTRVEENGSQAIAEVQERVTAAQDELDQLRDSGAEKEEITQAEKSFQSAQSTLSRTQKEQTRALSGAEKGIREAQRDVKTARKDRDQAVKQVQERAKAALGKMTNVARSGLKAKLDSTRALGTAEQLFTKQEGAALGDQARSGLASQTEIEESLGSS